MSRPPPAAALDPSTPASELEQFVAEHPAAVAGNPNARADQVARAFYALSGTYSTGHLGEVADAVAMNPALPLLLLENPHLLVGARGFNSYRGRRGSEGFLFEGFADLWPETRHDKNVALTPASRRGLLEALSPWSKLQKSIKPYLDQIGRVAEVYPTLQKMVEGQARRKLVDNPHRGPIGSASYLVVAQAIQRYGQAHEELFQTATGSGYTLLTFDDVPASVLALVAPHSLYQLPPP